MSPFSPSLDVVPVLARGRHRTARSGACFMEYASFLAGEKWSDRPSCTNPALAATARLVNDWTTDAERSRLAPMIPSVIGLTSSDPVMELAVAVRAAVAAIPVASDERQKLLAVGLLRCISRLAEVAPDQVEDYLRLARRALDDVPLAERWARRHIDVVRPPRVRSDAPVCDAVIAIAVTGIGEACIDDSDARLRQLLADAITECATRQPGARPSAAAQPSAGVQPASEAHARTLEISPTPA